MNVQRLHGITTGQVDAIEEVRQLHEIAKTLAIAHSPSAIEIGTVRRAGDVHEQHPIATDGHFARLVARDDIELRGRLSDLLQDKIAIHPYVVGVGSHGATGSL